MWSTGYIQRIRRWTLQAGQGGSIGTRVVDTFLYFLSETESGVTPGRSLALV